MEEVPAHVHPGPIVPDVLTRQHEHRSELIWSDDHETCITDLQCRRFSRNLFQSYSTAPRRHLCTAALGGAQQIGGALVLFQIWVWCMVSIICILGCTPSQHDIQQTFFSAAITSMFAGARFSLFQAPPPPGTGSSSFQAPPPPGTVGSSTPYMPVSTASSSDTDENDEWTDVVTPAHQLGFGHRVGKKIIKFTPPN
ncbi:hypothetical protein M9H77_11882 [Catharanthus roseus]|uniref:Uncharacterized protein n=1 Tax=Catharanthus roseus TaxID=4058 RepID=A0ACC0BG02_CATRO|nr:hypothetical protein M9H77_11882 [Catharanthus roseus]